MSIRDSLLNISAGSAGSVSKRQREQNRLQEHLEVLPNYKFSCCIDQAQNKKKPIIDLFSILNPRL